ncbi:hypothetical protein T01_10636 [Trichinella spiralis]|uniref:Uncharacterized protein n=1 Tax=Trichinella spiralis TaxID=6334 RepID=A0A0V1ASJ0_TRISP|nr:hypothetical protein T01_10636 [Trichinella spiralis]
MVPGCRKRSCGVRFDAAYTTAAICTMHEIAFLRFSLAKKTTRLQKVVEALLNFEEGYPFDGDQVCVSRTPRRPDLSYINPQIEDSHPFPLIVSEFASEHRNNVYPSPPA